MAQFRFMAVLRIRIELNKGRIGMPLGKLAGVCAETVKFLDMLSADLQLAEGTGTWLAENFENSSVNFDCRLTAEISQTQAEVGRRALRMLMSATFDDPELSFRIRPETVVNIFTSLRPSTPMKKFDSAYATMAKPRPSSGTELTRHEELLTPDGLVDRGAYGEIQGAVNAFFKEGRRPYLRVRELSTRRLVKCFFGPEMYQAAVELLTDRNAVVFVEGYIREDADTGETSEIEVKDFRPAPVFSKEESSDPLGRYLTIRVF